MKRRGSTLLELIVVLAIMGFVAGVVTLSFPAKQSPGTADALASARRTAIAERRSQTIVVRRGDVAYDVTVLPDGSVVADSALHIDRLTGERSDAR